MLRHTDYIVLSPVLRPN